MTTADFHDTDNEATAGAGTRRVVNTHAPAARPVPYPDDPTPKPPPLVVHPL